MEELLKQTKSNLRGVIESSQVPLLLNEVPTHYESLVYKSIPFRELGFASLLEFYRNIPDTVYIEMSMKGPVLLAVPSKNSAHVERMVKEQRCCNSKALWERRPLSYVSPSYRNDYQKQYSAYPAPSMYMNSNGYPYNAYQTFSLSSFEPQCRFLPLRPIQSNLQTHRQAPSEPAVVPRAIPESVKFDILNIINDHRNGLSFPQLQHIYSGRKGVNLNPLTYGYSSWQDFIAEMSETVRLKNTGRNVVIYPALCSPQNGNTESRPTYNNRGSKSNLIDSNKLKEKGENTGEFKDTIIKKDVISGLTNSGLTKNSIDYSDTMTLREFLDKNSQRLSNFVEPVYCNDIESQQSHLEELHKVAFLLGNVGDGKGANEEASQNKQIICPSVDSKKDSSDFPVSNEDKQANNNKLLRKVLEVLCATTKNGASFENLKTLFEHVHDEKLDVEAACGILPEIWFSNMKEFFEIVEIDDKEIIQVTTKGRQWLDTQVKRPISSRKVETVPEKSVPEDEICDEKLPEKVPADAVICCKSVSNSILPANITVGSYHTVYVSDGLHPEKFWIQLKSQVSKLKDLEEEMNLVYENESLSKPYEISFEVIAEQYKHESLTCACYYRNSKTWARAMVMDVIDTDSIYVSFIDYGINGTVSVTELRFIKEKFMSVPVLCFQAGMMKSSRIHDNEWSIQSKRKFSDVCVGKECIARFKSREIPLILDLIIKTSTGQLNVMEILEKFMNTRRSKENSQDEVVEKVTADVKRPQEVNGVKANDHISKSAVQVSETSQGKSVKLLDKSTDEYSHSSSNDSLFQRKVLQVSANWQNDVKTCKTDNSELKSHNIDKRISVDEVTAKCSVDCNDESVAKPRTSTPSLVESDCASLLPVKFGKSWQIDMDNDISTKDRLYKLKEVKFDSIKKNTPTFSSVIQSTDGSYQILPLALLGKQLHVIYLNEVNYFITYEVSRLFWKADILLELVKTLGLELPMVIIEPKLDWPLFQDLVKHCEIYAEMPYKIKEPVTLVSMKEINTVLPQIGYLKQDTIQALFYFSKMFS